MKRNAKWDYNKTKLKTPILFAQLDELPPNNWCILQNLSPNVAGDTQTHTSVTAMCFLPASNPGLSKPWVVPLRCHLPQWLSPAHVLSQSCEGKNDLASH